MNDTPAKTAASTDSGIQVIPTGTALGADITGFNINAINDADAAFIHQAWLDHLVLRIRGQQFGDDVHLAFARQFGELDLCPPAKFAKPYLPDYPEMSCITNLKDKDGKPLGSLANYECLWHTDMSYIDSPPTGSVLHAIEIPPSGGETSFANMYMAYETLPDDIRTRIDLLKIKHDPTFTSDGKLRLGFTEPETTDVRELPGPLHPIARTHPDTGRKALYLGRRKNSYIDGLELEESEALLYTLWAHASQEKFSWTQNWQVGDLIMWDNRCCMHRRNAFDDNDRRLMHRTVIQGDRPF